MRSNTERTDAKRKRKQPPPGIPALDLTPYPRITNVYGPPELEDEMDTDDPESWNTGDDAEA